MHLDGPGTRRVPVVVYCCTPNSVVIFRKHCTLIYIDHKHPTRETVGLPAHVCSLRKRTQWLPFLCPLISTPWASYLSDLLVLVQREKSRAVGKHVIVTEIKLLYMHHKYFYLRGSIPQRISHDIICCIIINQNFACLFTRGNIFCKSNNNVLYTT